LQSAATSLSLPILRITTGHPSKGAGRTLPTVYVAGSLSFTVAVLYLDASVAQQGFLAA